MISRRQIIESHQELNESDLLYGASDDSRRSSSEGDEDDSGGGGANCGGEEEEFNLVRSSVKPNTKPDNVELPKPSNNALMNNIKDIKMTRDPMKMKQITNNRTSAGFSNKSTKRNENFHYDSSGKLMFPMKDQERDIEEEEEEEEESSCMSSGEGQMMMAGLQDETSSDNNNLHLHDRQHHQLQQHHDYRHFDPYSVYGEEDEEEDVWYSEERLFEDHLQEIVDKWMAIDDEIWAKIICMERNRRIAKAYARKHSLTVNGSEDKYHDGTTLGLNSFDNPDRDAKTRRVKQYIGHGLRISITQSGDIVVKRLSKADVFVHQLSGIGYDGSANSHGNYLDQRLRGSNSSSDVYALNSESGGDCYGVVGRAAPLGNGTRLINSDNKTGASSASTSSSSGWPTRSFGGSKASSGAAGGGLKRQAKKLDRVALSQSSSNVASGFRSCALELNRPMKIFDMNEFKLLLERESRRPTPNRRFIQSQCISVISFVLDDRKMLNLPSWIMIINIVAIDLLKTELGLMDPHDLFGPLAEPPTSTPPPPLEIESGQSAEEDMCTKDDNAAAANVARPSSGKTQRGFAASKKAFANAAALGAYNGDHFRDADRAKPLRHEQNHSNWAYGVHNPSNVDVAKKKRGPRAAIKAGSDSQLNRVATAAASVANSKKQQQQQQQQQLYASEKTADKEGQQQSSSSSGFNSHCSSQNDSSAASSSSNIAGAASSVEPEKPIYRGVANLVGVFRKKSQQAAAAAAATTNKSKEPVKRKATKSPAAPSSDTTGLHLAKKGSELGPRGKRPPKLPHRINQHQTATTVDSMSDQIPATTQANLILVSPTGLSPPLPKRKVGAQRLGGSYSALDGMGDANVPEFSTIKHIDENGKCSVLAPVVSPPPPARLPNGIPAHAQLAPPATQRKVLRYLMSARPNLAEVHPTGPVPPPPMTMQAQAAARRGPVMPTRYQRPLPILPGQKQQQQRSPGQDCDESLYYYGLQARVPNQRRQPTVVQQRPIVQPRHHPVITKSAIDAILTDFKLNSQQKNKQQIHYVNPYLRPQFSLNNLHQQYSQQQQQQQHHKCNDTYCTGCGSEDCRNGADNIYNLSKQSSSKPASTGAPMMSFFRARGASNKQAMQNRALFSSVDNLHQRSQQKSSSSLLGFTSQGFLSKFKANPKGKKTGSKQDCST